MNNQSKYVGIMLGLLIAGMNLANAQLDGIAMESGPWIAPESEKSVVNPIKPDADSIEIGEEVYRINCLSCHGVTGGGDGPTTQYTPINPRDLADPEFQASATDGEWHWKISTGRNAMNPYEDHLSTDEIWHVVNYVRTLERNDQNANADLAAQRIPPKKHDIAERIEAEIRRDLDLAEEEIDILMTVDNGRPMIMLSLGMIFFLAGLLALIMEMAMERRSGDEDI